MSVKVDYRRQRHGEAQRRNPMNTRFSTQVLWFQQHRLSKMKISTVKTMQGHLSLYLLPKWLNSTLRTITGEKVNERLSSDDLSHLSPTTMKHVVTTLSMVVGKRFAPREIRYPSVRREREERRCYLPEEMTAL